MVAETIKKSSYEFEDVFTKKQIQEIIKESIGEEHDCKVVKGEVKAASTDGIIGYLGEHLRAVLHVSVNGFLKQIHIFIKRMPCESEGKCKLLEEFNFFERESAVLNFFKKLGDVKEPKPWHTKAYICNESIIVMPDLALDGYKIRNREETFDLDHMLVAAASLGRFHAASANYETMKRADTNRPYPILEEYGHVLKEVSFVESPWLDTVAQLSVRIIEELSLKFKSNISPLQEKLIKSFIQACESLKETENSLNVLLHKDLWSNNVMFKYDESKPVNALFVDYQCVRYGPPSFDVMVLLYMNSSRAFRNQYEENILEHYFSTFQKSIDDTTKGRLENLKYNFEDFKQWCDKSRMFALLEAIAFLPYTIMASDAAQKSLNDPDKFVEYVQSDRSGPVIEHAKESCKFKDRILEVNEEFVERFLC